VPRLHRYGEAVDDHQVPFARRLAETGLLTLVEDPADLAAALAGPVPPLERTPGGESLLAADLRAYLEELVGYST